MPSRAAKERDRGGREEEPTETGQPDRGRGRIHGQDLPENIVLWVRARHRARWP